MLQGLGCTSHCTKIQVVAIDRWSKLHGMRQLLLLEGRSRTDESQVPRSTAIDDDVGDAGAESDVSDGLPLLQDLKCLGSFPTS